MTCKHARGDRSCSNQFPEYHRQDPAISAPKSPDVENFEIMDAVQCGTRMVFKVKYPNCSSCAYEGTKILVYENVTPLIALKWRRIDPHFADPRLKRTATMAPAPMARFPASDAGWNQALWFATNYKGPVDAK